MAVISLLLVALFLVAFLWLAASLGYRLVRPFSAQLHSDAERILCWVATGVVVIQILIVPSLLTTRLRLTLIPILAAAFLYGLNFSRPLARTIRSLLSHLRDSWHHDWFLYLCIALAVLIEFLAAMAPLTASDALHYHFAVPAQILRNGFHPDFFLSTSFFCGQSHLLILLGLAVAGQRLASGLVFLGGILAAAALAILVRRWTDRSWSLIAALSFLLTPLVFWHIASPGAPDLWMALFTVAGVLIVSRCRELTISTRFPVIVAGCLAGGVAGAKYTGCLVAFALLIALLVETRSAASGLVFSTAALITGVWPYLRNILWTGDPFFPFLLSRISPERVNASALHWYLAATGADSHKSVLHTAKALLFSDIDMTRVGFFQYYGPLVLAFAPFLMRTVRSTPLWRGTLIVWIVSVLGNSSGSGMARFQLAVFPLALGACFAAAAAIPHSSKALRVATRASIVLALFAGMAGLFVYGRNAVKVSLGFTSREDYLQQFAPDYQAAAFTNSFFRNHPSDGKVLVFNRHVYYLDVPFVWGDPTTNWAIDPARLQTPAEWRALFAWNDINWVVRNPAYPAAIAAPLQSLEASGELVPVAQGEVENFVGKRILGTRARSPIVILRVRR